MAPPRSSAKRSRAEWAVRGSLASVIAVGSLFGLSYTLGYALRADLARAHVMAPGDGRITALLAQQSLTATADRTEQSRAVRLAKRALLQDPTAVPAVTTLGLVAQLRGQEGTARRLFAYAQSLSRRDFQTQLWSIEDAVRRGDIAQALRHYDIALRTTRSAPDLLFPVLTSAIVDAAVRNSLARTLATRPTWADGFLGYLIANGKDWRAIADLTGRMRLMNASVPADVEAATINGLVSSGLFADAWRRYVVLRPGAKRRYSRDPQFRLQNTSPSSFDWVAVNDGSVTTSIEGGIVDFSAPATVGGSVIRQVQMAPPGDYLLNGHASGIDQQLSARPYWTLTCQDGREVGRVVMPSSGSAGGSFSGKLRVPANCPVQTLTLIARASDTISGTVGQIDRVQFGPARASK